MIKVVEADGWVLKHKSTGVPVIVGERVRCHRGMDAFVCGGTPPIKRGSTGLVSTALTIGGIEGDYYVKLYDLVWEKTK